ncbi:MAG: MBL fold metallo-hydrolase [Christensenellales bacterium]
MELCPLFSGSSGNASLLRANNTTILIDAGMAAAAIAAELGKLHVHPSQIDAIVITHEHTDHIRGAGALSRKYDLPVYANAGTWQAMEPMVGKVRSRNIRVFQSNSDFYIRDLGLFPFSISHDAAEPVGYCVEYRGKKISFLTDLGRFTNKLLEILSGSGIVLVESNHDVEMLKTGPYPAYLKKRISSDKGHLSNEAAANAIVMLAATGVRGVLLGHLSQQNNREVLALETARNALIANGERVGLAVAKRDGLSGIFTLK